MPHLLFAQMAVSLMHIGNSDWNLLLFLFFSPRCQEASPPPKELWLLNLQPAQPPASFLWILFRSIHCSTQPPVASTFDQYFQRNGSLDKCRSGALMRAFSLYWMWQAFSAVASGKVEPAEAMQQWHYLQPPLKGFLQYFADNNYRPLPPPKDIIYVLFIVHNAQWEFLLF